MNYDESIKTIVLYIETNLFTSLSPKDLSLKCHVSEFHFYRIFKSMIGTSVMDYINKRRLSEKTYQWALSNKSSSLLELAMETGFSSQSAFTRAFKHCFLITPSYYYQNFDSYKDQLYPPFNFFHYKEFTTSSIYDYSMEIVTLNSILVIGKKIRSTLQENQNFSDINAVALDTLAFVDQIPNLADINAPCIGVVYDATIDLTNSANITFDYLRGFHISKFTILPPDFILKKIPKSQYIKFKTTSNEVVYKNTLNYIFTDYLIKEQIDIRKYPITLIEKFRTDQMIDGYCLVEIYIPFEYKN